MTKTILVTGCCGFIGSNMCNFLINKGYKVIGIDNMLTGRMVNLNNFINHSKFTFIKHDVCSPINIKIKLIKFFTLHQQQV